MPRLHPTFQEPDIQIDGAALDAWRLEKLEDAEALLTTAIPTSQDPHHHVLASRALVQTRLGYSDAALDDAEKVFAALTYADADANSHKVYPNSAIRHWLHCKERRACRQGGKVRRVSGVRHRVRAFPFNSR